MKYTRMLCLVTNQEKQILIRENKTNNIIFVNTEKEIIDQLNENIFPVISVNRINDDVCNIVNTYSNIQFFLLFNDVGVEATPSQAFRIILYSNVSPDKKKRAVFKATELIALFEGRDIID
jgi:hypothetical protein